MADAGTSEGNFSCLRAPSKIDYEERERARESSLTSKPKPLMSAAYRPSLTRVYVRRGVERAKDTREVARALNAQLISAARLTMLRFGFQISGNHRA
jgi:hypothetical protein